jgi:hypothetical protein
MSDDKELWIDLHTLVPCATLDSGFLHIHYQYTEKYPQANPDPTLYNLRTALRALGFKITRIVKTMNSSTVTMMTIQTNVPSDLYEKTMSIYNDWIGSVEEDEFADSDSDNSDDPKEHKADEEDEEIGCRYCGAEANVPCDETKCPFRICNRIDRELN